MALASHYGHAVKHLAVDFGLGAQSFQAVPIRLDLKPVEMAIHKSHVNADLASAKTEFLNEYTIRIPIVLQNLRSQCWADFRV